MEQVLGLKALRQVILGAAVLAYVVIFAIWIAKVWGAKSGVPPVLDGTVVVAGTALAGALGTGFALAMGLEKQKGDTSRTIGWTAMPKGFDNLILTAGVWLYVLVSGACLLTLLVHKSEMPGDLETLTASFTAYVLTLVTSAFGAIRPPDAR